MAYFSLNFKMVPFVVPIIKYLKSGVSRPQFTYPKTYIFELKIF
jgi:hypothetical protein